MFCSHDNQYSHKKRQKLSANKNFLSLSSVNNLKKDFLLELNGNSEYNLNKESSIPSWVKYDLSKINKQFDLSGGNWVVGLEALVIKKNSFNSWKNAIQSKTNLTSLAFIKIGIKYIDKPTEIMGIKFFENRLYSKLKVLSQLNTFLSAIWTKPCRVNSDGINIVGEIFVLTIFAFYLNKLNSSIHILSLGNISDLSGQKSWNLFLKVFDFFKKDPKNKIERIEIYLSNELNLYLGDFQISSEISNFKSDKDLKEYDKDLTALDIRCGLIPYPSQNLLKVSNIDMMPKYETPNITPFIISIYTNIPITDRANERLINGGMYQLLTQIPMKILQENFSTSIQYFPKKISYKTISQNYSLDTIEILLINSETNKLINLSKDFILNLEFKRLLEH